MMMRMNLNLTYLNSNQNYLDFIKVLIIISLSLFSTWSCSGTIISSSNPEFIEDYRTFKVKQLGGGKYFMGSKGTPLTTVQEARIEWDHKAKQVCGGVNIYLGEYKQEQLYRRKKC